jgi:hypothetical protein
METRLVLGPRISELWGAESAPIAYSGQVVKYQAIYISVLEVFEVFEDFNRLNTEILDYTCLQG